MSTTEPNRTATAITRHRFNNVRKTEQIFDLSAFLFWKLGSHSYVPWHGDKSRTPPFLLSWRFSDSGFIFNRPRFANESGGFGYVRDDTRRGSASLVVALLFWNFGVLGSCFSLLLSLVFLLAFLFGFFRGADTELGEMSGDQSGNMAPSYVRVMCMCIVRSTCTYVTYSRRRGLMARVGHRSEIIEQFFCI